MIPRAVLAVTAVLSLACSTGPSGPAPSSPPPPGATGSDLAELVPFEQVTVTLHPGDGPAREMTVYLADDPSKRQQGLRRVEQLSAGAGMLFVRPADTECCFTMQDTLVPLSVAFTDADGEVVGIVDMEPCRRAPCPLYHPGTPYRHALEAGQGFFDEIGLGEGDRISIPGHVVAGAS